MDHSLPSSSSSSKVSRRIVEKNRRNQMKVLYSRLNSLLPNQDSKEIAPTLPDQIDEAINYIKFLEMKLNMAKEKKEKLVGNEQSSSSSSSCSISPQLKVLEMGSILEVVLTSGLENKFLFYEIIRIVHQEGGEVVNASCSVSGNSVFHTVHAEIVDSMFDFGVAKVRERLKNLVYGSTSDVELQTKWGDLEFDSEKWGF